MVQNHILVRIKKRANSKIYLCKNNYAFYYDTSFKAFQILSIYK